MSERWFVMCIDKRDDSVVFTTAFFTKFFAKRYARIGNRSFHRYYSFKVMKP